MKRVGPELKVPDFKNVKVPGFLADLYHDLVDRRLLPLVGLILFAIVAMPFLLGQSGDEGSPKKTIPPASPDRSAQASSLTVVEANPGLRDYHRRLRGRTPSDPFRQHYTGAPAGSKLPGETSSTSSTSSSVSEEGSSTGGSTVPGETVPSSPPSSGGGSTETGGLRLFTIAVDVKITTAHTTATGKVEHSEPEVRREVIPPAPLPSAKTQAVTYMGISPKTGKPLLLVSDAVEAIYGESHCLSGTEKCQLLEVDLQMPTTFVYEPTGARFKINVLKVEPVLHGQFKG